jgi:transcriptional regulator with XRE-family HTH domain
MGTRKRLAMGKKLGHAIREARLTARLTQEQLGRRLGLKGRAVYRWENNDSAPTRRHERELVLALQAISPGAAASLQAAFAAARPEVKPPSVATPTPEPAAPSISPGESFALAFFRMADELDLAPRRLRRPLARVLERMHGAGFTLETAQRMLAGWIAEEG